MGDEVIAIPEPDRAKYGHMPERLYWEMLEGEDPDDRAIREAHGIGYTEPVEGTVCRNGCGLAYEDISAGKIRECEERGRRHPMTDTRPAISVWELVEILARAINNGFAGAPVAECEAGENWLLFTASATGQKFRLTAEEIRTIEPEGGQ